MQRLNLFFNNIGSQKVIKSVFSLLFNPRISSFSSRKLSASLSVTTKPSSESGKPYDNASQNKYGYFLSLIEIVPSGSA